MMNPRTALFLSPLLLLLNSCTSNNTQDCIDVMNQGPGHAILGLAALPIGVTGDLLQLDFDGNRPPSGQLNMPKISEIPGPHRLLPDLPDLPGPHRLLTRNRTSAPRLARSAPPVPAPPPPPSPSAPVSSSSMREVLGDP